MKNSMNLEIKCILNASSMFNHSNLKLPSWLDNLLRLFIVTPDMHRVHHSVETNETNSNFGFNLSCWDRLFKTYIKEPKDGHKNMKIGLLEYQDSNKTNLWDMLTITFKTKN